MGQRFAKLKQAALTGGVKLGLALAELGLIDEYEFVVSGAPFSGLV